MSNSISAYYYEELSDWNDMLRYCQDDALEFEKRLLEVLNRNGIPGMAAKVENLLSQLEHQHENFFRLGQETEEQEKDIVQAGDPIDNSAITNAMITRQAELRKKMQAAENDFIKLKYACYEFLSGMLTHK